MLKHLKSSEMGRGIHGWLDSHFHFSFAEYYNPDNIHFGALRVLNDDIIAAGTGFEMHPHRDMEIISYIVEGELSHKDSMGNEHTLSRGQVQYMSAGTGIFHSEHNWGDTPMRLIQVWILPDSVGYKPAYGDFRFKWEDRFGRWLPLVTSYDNNESTAPVKIHQDANIYATIIDKGSSIDFAVNPGRIAYLVVLEGKVTVNDIAMAQRDALEVVEEDLKITADKDAHLYLIEMKKGT